MNTVEQLTQSIRTDYTHSTLTEAEALPDPMAQFEVWLQAAIASQQPEPNAMALATVSAAGQPSCRIVLLRGVNAQGFHFFTNYESRKGQELEATHRCALTFFWPGMERQVRIEGTVERLSAAESDAYYQSRPAGSRLGAWASPQSQVLPGGRAQLEALLHTAEAQHATEEALTRPPFWGGYRCTPHAIEFWQGRTSRLHDRLRYTRNSISPLATAWVLERLAP